MQLDHSVNELGQPVGLPLNAPVDLAPPPRTALRGQYCDVVPLDVDRHAAELFNAYAAADDDGDWTYLPYGPFTDLADFVARVEPWQSSADPMFHAVIDRTTGLASGIASYLRIAPDAGSIEVGHIHFARCIQGTPAATEAMYLMMKQAFELGYRRYEWKCDALNVPSRQAALRFGFGYEGLFRQAAHYKGRNRDTTWFAIIDSEWPERRERFERWLDPTNFDGNGRQLSSLNPRA